MRGAESVSSYCSSYAYAIALPAKDEEERIVDCLEACAAAMTLWPEPGVIVLVVNNSRDRTGARAQAWAHRSRTPMLMQTVHFPENMAHAGSARRAALDRARQLVGAEGYLLTTDADSRPDVNWVSANLEALVLGTAALVCGAFDVDADDYARLPVQVRERALIEDRYRQTALELDRLVDPNPFNPWPLHGRASGASLAMSATAYDLIGGAPVVPCAEDRALVRQFMLHDLPILYSDAARVTTSGRLNGRAPGGMADTIASRVAGATYVCDETVEAADMVWARAHLRARLRAAFQEPALLAATLADIGLQRPPETVTSFGAFWAVVESTSPLLKRRRLLWEEMLEQLPRLEALRDKAKHRAATPTFDSMELVA